MAEMDQDQHFQTLPIGERLRQSREARNLSLDDVAAQTRIPTRHLQHIERGEWDALPAVTYSVGFARSYANAVGLNGPEIAAELREQLGSGRTSGSAEYYQPADSSRVPPRSLALVAAVIGILLVVGYLIWRSGIDDGPAAETPGATAQIPLPAPQPVQPAPAPSATGPVVLTAIEPVWLRVSDGGVSLYEGTLLAGQSFSVPATAQQPMLRVGAPQALRVTVGEAQIPQLGPAGRPVGNVSLLPADLAARAQGGTAPAPVPAR